MNNNMKVASINVKLKNFFFRFVEFTAPFHKLSKPNQKVLSLLLYYHYILSKDITNNKLLWKAVFDYDTKLLIAEELNLNQGRLQNILTSLRKEKVIIDNKVSKLYIPEVNKDFKQFVITFNFNIVNDK